MQTTEIIQYFGLREDTTDPRWAGTAKHVFRGHSYEPHDIQSQWYHIHRIINRYDSVSGGTGEWNGVEEWGDDCYREVWACPKKQSILTYCEGDLTLVVCDTAEEYEAEYARAEQFYQQHAH